MVIFFCLLTESLKGIRDIKVSMLENLFLKNINLKTLLNFQFIGNN